MAKTEHTEYLGETDYPAVAVVYILDSQYTAHVEFRAYEAAGWDDDGPLYELKDGSSSVDMTHDRALAEPYLSGSVKWDGCSHITFGDENGYLHLCGRKDFDKLIQALAVIYERCGALMKARDVYLLEGEFHV